MYLKVVAFFFIFERENSIPFPLCCLRAGVLCFKGRSVFSQWRLANFRSLVVPNDGTTTSCKDSLCLFPLREEEEVVGLQKRPIM